jgi:hypothetical protein
MPKVSKMSENLESQKNDLSAINDSVA